MGEASTEFSPQPSRWEENTVLGTVEVGAKHPWIEFESRNHAVSMHVGEEGGRWATVRGNQSDRGDPPAPSPEDTWLRKISVADSITRATAGIRAREPKDATRALGFCEWTYVMFKTQLTSPVPQPGVPTPSPWWI